MKVKLYGALFSHKMRKTMGWALISGILFLGSTLWAGAAWWPALVATLFCVAVKTPFYWLWEHAYDWLAGLPHKPAPIGLDRVIE
jgi:hypothetical protein